MKMLTKYLKDKKGRKMYIGIFLILLVALIGTFVIAQIAEQQQDLSNIKDKKFKYEFLDNGLIKIEKNRKTLGEFGFVFTGDGNGTQVKYKSEDFSWSWKVDNNLVNANGSVTDAVSDGTYYITTITGTNNNQEFPLTTQLIINPKIQTKVKTIITNNLGNITNAKFWYVNKIEQGIKIKSGNEDFTSSLNSVNLDNLESRPHEIEIGDYQLNYGDLNSNNFSITDVYSGNRENLGYNDQSIVAIGVAKNEGVLTNGETIELDPIFSDTGFKSPAQVTTDTGIPGTNNFTAPQNAKVSDNNYATSNLIGANLWVSNFSLLQSEGGTIPDGAYIQGIDVQVESSEVCLPSGGYLLDIYMSGNNGLSYKAPKRQIYVDGAGDTYYSWSQYYIPESQDTGGNNVKWNTTELSNANFKIRISLNTVCSDPISVDHVRVKVGWTAPSIANITNTNLDSYPTIGTLIYHLSYSNVTPTINLNNLVINSPFDWNDTQGSLPTFPDYHPSQMEFFYSGRNPVVNLSCGLYGMGGCFNGSQLLVSDGTHSRFYLENFTIGAWTYKTVGTSGRNVIAFGRGTGEGIPASEAPNWNLRDRQGTIMEVGFAYANGTYTFCRGGNSIVQNVWEYYVGIKNSTGMSIYRNGTLEASCNINSTAPMIHTRTDLGPVLDIGAVWNSVAGAHQLFWIGNLDEIMVLDTALNSSQILGLYNNQSKRFYPRGEKVFYGYNISTNNTINISTLTVQPTGTRINISVGRLSGNSYVYDNEYDFSNGDISGLLIE